MCYITAMKLSERSRRIADDILRLAQLANDRVSVLQIDPRKIIMIAYDTNDIGKRIERDCERERVTFGSWRTDIE